jgi:predicted transposase YbfD/YdcC
LQDQCCTLASDASAEAVIGEAEAIARDAARKEEAKARRKALKDEGTRERDAARERKAAERAERERAGKAEGERLRARAEAARAVLLERAAELRDLAGGTLRSCFEGLEEPRDPRGIRHPLPAVLSLVVMAVLRGKVTMVAVTGWIKIAGQDLLEMAGARHRDGNGQLTAPSPRTVTRVLGLAGPQPLSDAVGAYLAAAVPGRQPDGTGESGDPDHGHEQEQEQGEEEEEEEPPLRPHLQCDGKAVRGARRPDGSTLFILSAVTAKVTVADREIPAKTNEVPEIGPMLLELNRRLPLAGWVLTADAAHTQDDFAELTVTGLRAHYVLTVKDNRKNLRAALRGLCWAGARRHASEDTGHGRTERRSHLVMDAPEEIKAMFPHVKQVAKVIRTRTVRHWKGDGRTWKLVTATTTETVYLVTSLTSADASPRQIAAYIRAHWGIENRTHWVRDTTLREDACKVRHPARARNLATLRNLTVGLVNQSGLTGIAATIRATEGNNDLISVLGRFTTAL